jgi:hypothetical protein
MYQQPAPQPMMQPQQYQPQPAPQQGYPNAMDPQIAQAMVSQAFGAPVTAEYVQPQQQADPVGGGSVYDDEDMPF